MAHLQERGSVNGDAQTSSNKDFTREQFEGGLLDATDPLNASVQPGGRAVTTLQSPWLHSICPECRHSFRPGDIVRVERQGLVRHDMAALPCAGQLDSRPNALTSQGFYQGLDEAWPPPADVVLCRLEGSHPLVSSPRVGFRRFSCAICSHTLREGDLVVLCPCHPEQPKCRVAIHRDALHGLHCWDAWLSVEGRRFCPATSWMPEEHG